MDKLAEQTENINRQDANSLDEHLRIHIFDKDDLKSISSNANPTYLLIYNNSLIVPSIDFSSVTKFLLSVSENIETLDIFFEQMPNLIYFGYMYILHSHNSKLNPKFFNIKTNNKMNDVEIAVSEYDFDYEIDYKVLCSFIQKFKVLKSLRIDLNIFKRISKLLIENEIKFIDLYLNWDYYFDIPLDIHTNYRESPKHFLQLPFEKKVYHNLFLQVCTQKVSDKFLVDEYLPGIKEINYPSNKPFQIIRKSKWFDMDCVVLKSNVC